MACRKLKKDTSVDNCEVHYNIHCSISCCNKSINNCICCTRTTSISVGRRLRLRRRIDCSEEYLYKGDMYQQSRESSRWIWIWPRDLIQKGLSYFFETYSNTYHSYNPEVDQCFCLIEAPKEQWDSIRIKHS
jgi:hypothetical protein